MHGAPVFVETAIPGLKPTLDTGVTAVLTASKTAVLQLEDWRGHFHIQHNKRTRWHEVYISATALNLQTFLFFFFLFEMLHTKSCWPRGQLGYTKLTDLETLSQNSYMAINIYC